MRAVRRSIRGSVFPALSLIGRPVAGAMFSLAGSMPRARQDRRVDIFDGHRAGRVFGAFGIGLADRQTAAQAAAGQGQAIATRPVVAAARQVDLGRAAEFAAAEDDGPVERIPAFQVAQQRGEGGVEDLDHRRFEMHGC